MGEQFLGTFGAAGEGQREIVTFSGNTLAAGPVAANGSIVIYVSEVYTDSKCPERHGLYVGSNIVTLRFSLGLEHSLTAPLGSSSLEPSRICTLIHVPSEPFNIGSTFVHCHCST